MDFSMVARRAIYLSGSARCMTRRVVPCDLRAKKEDQALAR